MNSSARIDTAISHHQAGRLEQAKTLYQQILRISPQHADALHLLGLVFYQLGDRQAAIDHIKRALAVRPEAATFLTNLGAVYQAFGDSENAVASCQRALQINPGDSKAHFNLGCTYQALSKLDEAVANYRFAIRLKPDYLDAHVNLGNSLKDQGELEEAVACFRRAIQIRPNHARAHNNLGSALRDLGKLKEAIASYRRALAIDPEYAEAQYDLGNALIDDGSLDEAVVRFQLALKLKPDYVEANNNLGIVLKKQGKLEEAIACHQQALHFRPDHVKALNNLANVLREQGKPDEAVACYQLALQLTPGYSDAHSGLLFTLHNRAGVTLQGLAEAHAEYDRQHTAPLRTSWRPHDNTRDPDRPLRLGFVSPDLGQHPVGFFLIRVLEHLDHREAEITCYNDRKSKEVLTGRFQAVATSWREVSRWSDERLVQQIREDGIDILFDLAGHTARNRLFVFARKPAPIQITWIGYPGTTGLSSMDYILADSYLIPSEAEQYYCEKVLRMPEVFSCYEPPNDAPDVGRLPAAANGFVTFGSFNNPAKINAEVVATWSKILLRLPSSRLLLKYKNHYAGDEQRRRIVDSFAAHDISPERLEFPDSPVREGLLPLYHRIDLALDPFPYGGATTTCEALWMGVPVITCPGTTFASRYGLSFVTSVGLGELVARDRPEYVEHAVSLAGDLPRLAAFREELRDRMARSPLCDGPRFASNLLNTLSGIWREWCQANHSASRIPVPHSFGRVLKSQGSRSDVAANECLVEIEGGIKVAVKSDLESLTAYVLMEQGDWFEAEMAFVRRLVTPGMHILDIGANHGVYALTMASSLRGNGQVTAYEPARSVVELLRKSRNANALSNLEIVNAGLSDHEGEATLYISANSELNSLQQNNLTQNQDTIELLTLDEESERRGWPAIDFIKLDAEGEEAKILAGGKQFFAGQSPLVMFELKHGKQVNLPLIQHFQDLGYDTYRLVPGLEVLIPFDVDQPVDGYQLNLFACKADRAAELARRDVLVRQVSETSKPPPRSYWLNALESTGYATQFIAEWRSIAEAPPPDAETYLLGLNYFLWASRSEILPGEKVAALQNALQCIQKAVHARPSVARRCSLARVAAEFGERQVSVQTLLKLWEVLESDQSAVIDEPFLAVQHEYDGQIVDGDFGEWLYVSVVETFENRRVFSSYYSAEQSVNLLQGVVQRPFHSPLAERRLQLAQKRLAGDRQPIPINQSAAAGAERGYRYVFCAGMQRSGSTWSYNVARLLLQESFGEERIVAGYVGEMQSVDGAVGRFSSTDKILLLKFYGISETTLGKTARGEARTIFTYREPTNAVASVVDFFNRPLTQAVNAIDRSLQNMLRWQQTNYALLVQFDDLVTRCCDEIRRIAEHLELSASEELVKRVAEQTSYEATKEKAERLVDQSKESLVRTRNSAYDPTTLLHVGDTRLGVNRDWRTQFTAEEQKYVLHHLERWLDGGGQLRQQFGLPSDDHVECAGIAPEATIELALAHHQSGRLQEAEKCCEQMLQRAPSHPDIWHLLGIVAAQQKQFPKAIEMLKRAIELKSTNPIFHSNLGNAYLDQGQCPQAITAYQYALRLRPDNAEDLRKLGIAFRRDGQLPEAVASFEKSLQIRPNDPDTHRGLGYTYGVQHQIQKSIACYQRELELRPNSTLAPNTHLHYSSDIDPSAICAQHRQWGQRVATQQAGPPQPHQNDRRPARRLRIGYVSGNFWRHSVAYFFEPLLADHDRQDFEVICYANNQRSDATTVRLQQLADQWCDIHHQTDEAVAERIRSDGIDILVDLAGHTEDNRLLVFAHKPAPVQVTYIGYPNTSGLETMDYRLVDAWTDPEGQTDHLHTERLVRLPHGFLCYLPAADCPDVSPTPVLEKGKVIFASFNNSLKISPELIGDWCAILKAVPDSRLIIKSKHLVNPSANAHMREHFIEHGIDPKRLELVGRTPSPLDHLAMYAQVDIGLDTYPYHGTTTTCEAMWMGVPVVTRAGQTHVSRVGVSLLSSVGLEKLIAGSAEEYIHKAVELARDPQRLQDLRASLRDRMRAAPLTHAGLITQSIENAYREMWRAYCDPRYINRPAI